MRSLERALHALLITWLITLVAVVVHVGSAWTPAASFCGSVLVLLVWQPSRRGIFLAVALGIVAGWMYKIHGGTWSGSPMSYVVAGGAFLGVGSLSTMVLECLWARSSERRQLVDRLRCAAFMPAFYTVSGVLLGIAAILTPFTEDRLLFVTDLKFGLAPSWAVGSLFHSYGWLRLLCEFVYFSLPVSFVACLVAEQRLPQPKAAHPSRLQHVALVLGAAVFALFQICPAAGPILAFHQEFPKLMPQGLGTLPIAVRFAPRNCLPSFHLAGALALFWNMRRRNFWLSATLAGYSFLTILATLGTGQHYLVDLIASPALLLVAQAICSRVTHPIRWLAVTAGGVVTVGWVLAVRFGLLLRMPSAALVWSVAAMCILVAVALTEKLEDRAIEEGKYHGVAVERGGLESLHNPSYQKLSLGPSA
jgi:PAP2 superfamily